jgi:vacuolar-type H+-ATPase subunit H
MTSITYANPSDPSALQESFEALQKDFDEISQLALDLLKQKETEFHNKMESYREELDLKVDDLGSKFKKITGESQEQIHTIIEILKRKNQEMSDKAKEIIGQAKDEFTLQLDKTISNLDKKIEDLRKQSKNMSEDARKKLSRQLEVMREKNQEVVAKLEELNSKGIKTWDEIKTLIFNIWQDLIKTYTEEGKES